MNEVPLYGGVGSHARGGIELEVGLLDLVPVDDRAPLLCAHVHDQPAGVGLGLRVGVRRHLLSLRVLDRALAALDLEGLVIREGEEQRLLVDQEPHREQVLDRLAEARGIRDQLRQRHEFPLLPLQHLGAQLEVALGAGLVVPERPPVLRGGLNHRGALLALGIARLLHGGLLGAGVRHEGAGRHVVAEAHGLGVELAPVDRVRVIVPGDLVLGLEALEEVLGVENVSIAGRNLESVLESDLGERPEVGRVALQDTRVI
mmetsp:Transcript_48015/g.114283  ORF Transcript_48015/g.114283 Transcript_48015/m.114283 type:complete len:259 (+) Transcript_48015:166-942(+)